MASLREFHRCLEQDAPELEAGNTQPISISSAFTVLTWPLLERRLDQWPWSRRPLPHDNSRVRQCTLNPQSQAQGWHPEQVDIGIFIFISVIEDHLKAWDLRCVQPCVGLASNCQPQGEASSQEWGKNMGGRAVGLPMLASGVSACIFWQPGVCLGRRAPCWGAGSSSKRMSTLYRPQSRTTQVIHSQGEKARIN